MPKTLLTPEQVIYVVGERRKGRRNGDIAADLGVDSSTVSRAATRMGVVSTKSSSVRGFEIPIQRALVEFAKTTIKPIKARRGKRRPGKYMLAAGIWDAHIGSYAWADEVGEDWDTDIAVRRVLSCVDDVIEEVAPYEIGKVLMPVGNDILHVDSSRLTTGFGDHRLDVDTRFARVFAAALHASAQMVERFLDVCDDIELLSVPGNHDVTSSYLLCIALQQRYLHEPRVRVDISPNPRKYRLYGGTLLGFTHGCHMNVNNLSSAIAVETRELWAKSTYREVQVGDRHQRWERSFANVVPGGGILIRRVPALCNADYWTYSKAFLGEASRVLEIYRYDEVGFRGSHVVYAKNEATHPCAYLEKIAEKPRNRR